MNMGGWGTDTVSLQVRHAYLDFTIPNTPLTMQIGLQNRVIGGFLGRFFLNKDVPGYVLNFNSAPWTLSAMWFKGYKQSFYTDTDNDYYGLVYRLKQPTFNVEAWFFYNNDRRTQTEVWSYAQAGANPYTYALTLTTTARPYNYQPWWLGANVPITLGNFKIEATGIYQCGKYIADSSSASFVNADISAWLGDIMVTYRLGPGLSLLAEGFWATGVNGSRNANTSGGTYNQFTFFNMGSENRNVFGNGWSVFYFWNTQLSYYAGHQVDPGGHAFGRGNVEYNPLTWLNLNANYLYIYNTATNHYIAHITGAKNPYGTVVGQELNLIATIAIYKDFVYRIGYGYFFPGDVFDTPGGKSADQAWNLLTNLIYVF
jgi:hypothetical protein